MDAVEIAKIFAGLALLISLMLIVIGAVLIRMRFDSTVDADDSIERRRGYDL